MDDHRRAGLGSGAVFFGCGRNLDGEAQRDDDEGREPVGADDEQIATIEPPLQLDETVGSALHLNTTVDAEQRHRDIASEPAAGAAGQRDALRREAALLKQAH